MFCIRLHLQVLNLHSQHTFKVNSIKPKLIFSANVGPGISVKETTAVPQQKVLPTTRPAAVSSPKPTVSQVPSQPASKPLSNFEALTQALQSDPFPSGSLSVPSYDNYNTNNNNNNNKDNNNNEALVKEILKLEMENERLMKKIEVNIYTSIL